MDDTPINGLPTLAGIRVIDASRLTAGGFAGRLMADFGAVVIRIDVPQSGSPTDEHSAFSGYLALGKRSVVIDPSTLEGCSVFERLVATADVVIRGSNAHEGVFTEYSPSDIQKFAPSAVVTTVAATGDDDAHGYVSIAEELLLSARSGWAAINQVEGHAPLKPSGHQGGFQAGLAAFTATVAQLYTRECGNAPNRVDISMLEVLVATLSPALLQFQYQGQSRSRHRTGFPFGPVRAKDGHFVLTTSRAHFWRDAMNALGLSNLAEDARFADPTARDDLYAEVGPLVAERIAEHEKAELFNTLGTLRVSAGAVLDVAELTEDPHLAARDFFVSVPIGDAGDVLLPGAPFTAPESGWAIRARAPGAGEHSASVLSESGFSTDEVERLMRHGVVS